MTLTGSSSALTLAQPKSRKRSPSILGRRSTPARTSSTKLATGSGPRGLFTVSNAGGRAISALQSISTMEYLFHLQNVVVVHHSFCGATAFTAEGIIEE